MLCPSHVSMSKSLISKKRNILSKNIALLSILLLVATAQYILFLKSKWSYTSDSLFYTHHFYKFQGSTYEEARQKVLTNYPIPWKDLIQQNIFINPDTYHKVEHVFAKRPLYPLVALLLNYFVSNEYLSFIFPIFLGYLGVIIFNFHFAKIRLGYLAATISTLALIAFQPFLYWSTYIMTDTTGTFFWLLQIYFIYLFLAKNKPLYLILFTVSLIISLFNREQSILLIPFLAITFIILKIKLLPRSFSSKIYKLFAATLLTSTLFMLGIKSLGQVTAWDNLKYIQSNYYLNDASFTFAETFLFYISSVLRAHYLAIYNIVKNPFYLLVSTVGMLGMYTVIKNARKTRNPLATIDALFISSAFSSYLSIFIIPVFEYRFFFPVVISLLYFTLIYSINSLGEFKKIKN